MNIAIVYESSTGTTARAAEAMGRAFAALGHQCQVQSVSKADPAEVAKADLICIGAWVKGMFVIGQHPSGGSLMFIDRLGSLVEALKEPDPEQVEIESVLAGIARVLETAGVARGPSSQADAERALAAARNGLIQACTARPSARASRHIIASGS